MRILIFAERLAPPPDEGIKKLALNLSAALSAANHKLLVLTTGGNDWPEKGVTDVPANRLLRSPDLANQIATFKPEAVIYVPTASLTLASGLRARMLKHYAGGAPTALIATQGRQHNAVIRLIARLVAPDLCVTQSRTTELQAQALHWPTVRVYPGVDAGVYRPVSAQEKLELRKRYGVPADAWVILHVGHLNPQRGIANLAAVADLAYPLLVTSTSTAQDQALADELRRAGVHLITRYLENIWELYQLADAYLFPVPPNPTGPSSIDLPLSVLEALACNLPLLTTRFGALPDVWPDQAGIAFYDDVAGLRAGLVHLRETRADTRHLATAFSWQSASQKILDALMEDEKLGL